MTDYSNYTNKYIENKIVLNLKTLNSFSIGEHKKYSDIYSLTSHEYRYSSLSVVLKIMAIPLVVVSNVVKILSCEIVAVKEMVNIPLILLKKMDQGIAKKILQGLDDTNEAELRDITNNILEQWKEDNTLIQQEEESVFTRFKNYVCENVPFIESIRNFWVNGGIHYSKTQLEEKHLVKKITKEIFKTAYIAGKEANSLTSDDIYNHFKEIGAYKDNMPTKEIDLVQDQLFHSNDDIWTESILDLSYLSNDDTTPLLGPLHMKSQYQNYQKHLNGNYSNQDATMMQTQAVPLTEEDLNQGSKICYKKRREELNRRVKSLLEQKKQIVSTKN